MEQIIITKPSGSTYPLASKRTATQIKSAKQTMSLLGDDLVSMNIESPFSQTYGIGDKTTIFGRVYKLNQLPKVKKTGMHEFSYDLEFEGVQYDLLCATYDLTIDTTTNVLQDVQADSLTGDLRRFATVLVANANRVFPGKWVLGTCPGTNTVTLTFSETDNCLSVAQNLCSQFGYEFEITQNVGVNTMNFKKVGQLFPYTFQFGKGKGLYSLDRQNVSSSSIVTRLKVYGSSSNITSKYRAQRLCLPGKTKASSYIEKADAVAKYGIIEGKKFFDDIKPTFDGSVTGIVSGSVLKFVDTKMFDLNAKEADGITTKYLIEGASAKVHFNTGNLAGYEFEVNAYDHSSHTFTLVKQTDDRGDVFPSASSAAFQFKIGDEYKIIDVALPNTYEQAAETKLANDGDTYYNQNSQPKVQYGLSITKSYLQGLVGNGSTVNIFQPGDLIPIKDSDIDVDKSVRIQSLTRNLLDEYDYTLTISDTVSTNITNRVISELIDIDKVVQMNNLKDPAKARANWRSSREVLNMVFDPDGDYYTDKIKPNSIDTMALSVGSKSMQFGLTNTIMQPNYNGNKNLINVKGGVLTHYTIDENSARSWVLVDNETTLGTDTQAYYIYAKCGRVGTAGSIIFSTVQIKTEQDVNFYHFWIGVVNSVDIQLKARSVALSYGFTMINGRFIKTGRIESADGTTYFDLDNSEIGGRIVFTSNGSEKTLDQLGQESLESKDYINNTLPGILSDMQAQLDGQMEQFFYTYDPTTVNVPASDWTSVALKENHLGDLFYNTSTGKVFRWIKNGTVYSWQELQDSEVAQALSLANDALSLAKTKRRIFTETPYTPYDIGDLWSQGSDGDIMKCKTARATGSYTSSDWEKASNYTSDAALTTFISGSYATAINNMTAQIDGKIESWFQTSDPATSWTADTEKAKHVGDMWYSSSTKSLKRYSSAYAWVAIEDQTAIDAYNTASTAKDTADGKRRVFVATPYTPYDIGDLWVDGSQLRRCSIVKTSGQSYNVSDWVVCVAYDNTKTVIDGGLVTSGTIQVAGSESTILAGMTGQGTAADSIRFWAGASFEDRATAPFRVMQDGSVVMTKATVEGVINALSGTIGGFEIASGRIGTTQDNYGLSLLSSLLKFSDSSCWAGFGTNVFPASSGVQGLARFELDKSSESFSSGIALRTMAKFPKDGYDAYSTRRAIWNTGNVFSTGGHCLFDNNYIGAVDTYVIQDRIGLTHQYFFTSIGGSYINVYLPSKATIDQYTGGEAVTFELKIQVGWLGNGNRIRISGVDMGFLIDNNTNRPNGGNGWLDMAQGDSLVLRWYAGNFYIVTYST